MMSSRCPMLRPELLVVMLCLSLVSGPSGVSRGQSGSGEREPGRATPPAGAKGRRAPARGGLPARGVGVRVETLRRSISPVPLAMAERLPGSLGQYKRSKLYMHVDDYTTDDYGAVEFLKAEYRKGTATMEIFLSRFKDSASAVSTMNAFVKTSTERPYYFIVRRGRIVAQDGRQVGELVLLKINSTGVDKGKGHLMFTDGAYLYRIYSYNPRQEQILGDVQEAYNNLPL